METEEDHQDFRRILDGEITSYFTDYYLGNKCIDSHDDECNLYNTGFVIEKADIPFLCQHLLTPIECSQIKK
jgi:hypothetical protein